MDRQAFSYYHRWLFLILSALVVIGGIFCFVYGNFDFSHKYLFTWSILGGHHCALGLFFIVYGLMGVYSSYQRNQNVLVIFGGIAAVSFVARVVYIILAAIHKVSLDGWAYGNIGFELLAMAMVAGIIYLDNN